MIKVPLTAQRLREVLDYDRETGAFRWKSGTGLRVPHGSIAGQRKRMPSGKYRIVIKIDGRCHFAHRIAWLYVNGTWPAMEIDHFDGDSENNRYGNLREASTTINAQNRRSAGKRSTSGLLGVLRIKQGSRTYWQAKIMARGVSHYLGCYDAPEKAHAAYVDAKRVMHEGNTL